MVLGSTVQLLDFFVVYIFCLLFVGGHNSTEDAVACMELMIWKIKPYLYN